jgi:hypothetical protein
MKNMDDYIERVSKEKAKNTINADNSEKQVPRKKIFVIDRNRKLEITIAFSLLFLFFVIFGLLIRF